MYRCEDFGNVPKKRRRAALALKLPVWSPFANTGHYCVWSDAVAMVWLWDADQVSVDAQWLGDNKDNVYIVPETVFYSRKPDGVHVQACQEGFELQHWRDDALADSFWLPDEPDPARVDWFATTRGQTRTMGQDETAQTSAVLAVEPWSSPVLAGDWLVANERRLVVFGIALFVLAWAWQEARIMKAHWHTGAAEAKLEAMQEALGPVRAKRNEYQRLLARNNALASILRQPSQAAVMAQVDAGISNPDAEFRDWDYRQGELRVVLNDPDADNVAYVNGLNAQPLLRDVTPGASRGKGRVEFKMRVEAVR